MLLGSCLIVQFCDSSGLGGDMYCTFLSAVLVILTVGLIRLKRLKLPTLKYRCIRGDMIEVYKILTNKYDSRVNFIEFVPGKAAR